MVPEQEKPRPDGGWKFLRQRKFDHRLTGTGEFEEFFYDFIHKRSRATACYSFVPAKNAPDGIARKHLSLFGHRGSNILVYLQQFGLSPDVPIAMEGLGVATHFFDPPLTREHEKEMQEPSVRKFVADFVKSIWAPRGQA